jgi:uncharacterized membrane protein
MRLLAHVLLSAVAIGFLTGLRCMTPIAVTAWSAHLGRLALRSTQLSFLGSVPTVAVFTLGALGELIVDKLPKTPARTATPGLVARFVLGGLCGAALTLASGQVGWLGGAILGAIGGICGAFAGYQVRTRLVKALGVPDFVIALAEDAVAIASALLIVTHV